MKKIFLSLILIILVLITLSFVSCRHREVYRFLNPTDEIADISIVALSFDEDFQLIQTEIKRVDDVDAFISDFRDVNCYTYFGDPTGVVPEGISDTVIKIHYKNDEYELINWKGQAEYTLERGFKYYAGFSVFDEMSFESLITKYSSS